MKVGTTRLGVSFRIRARRASGDVRTSIENTKLNAYMCLYRIARESPLQNTHNDHRFLPRYSDLRKKGVATMVGGDDSVTRTGQLPAPNADCLRNTSLGLGFKFEPVIHTNLNHVTFYSGRFWPAYSVDENRDRRVWGPKPGRAIHKMSATLAPPGKAGWEQRHMRGVLLGYRQYAQYVPFLKPWVDHLLTVVDASDVQAARHWKPIATGTYMLPATTWGMVEDVYGMDQRDHDEFADFVTTITTVPCLVGHRLLAALSEKDS
jgi:hypothetical protein